ncbi:Rieske 2Fe-2S domain-containing protein [Nitriliruptoraceae bacterium ZYF776]|nr:Rieske 2Fe-2S domain-containing protein [Profundirhabdus halotolerans]
MAEASARWWRRRRDPAVPPIGPEGAVEVAAATDVPDRPPFLAATVGGHDVLVARLDGRLVAFDAACPHLGQPLRKARPQPDGTLECRHHHHAYDLNDGRCVRPGAALDEPLTLHEVGEHDGRVWVRPVRP